MAQYTYDPGTKATSSDPITDGDWVLPEDAIGGSIGTIQDIASPIGAKIWRINKNAILHWIFNAVPSSGHVKVLSLWRCDANNEPIGHRTRTSMTAPITGYFMGARNNTTEVRGRVWSNVTTAANMGAAAHSLTRATDKWFWVKSESNGSTHTVKMWEYDTSEPAVQLTQTNATYSEGRVGIGDFNTASNSDLAWFSVGTDGDEAPTPSVGGATDITVQDAIHGHVADNITLTTSTLLTVQDSQHGHIADNVTLSTGTALVTQDSLHGHVADNITLTTASTVLLVVADCLHSHTADNVALTSITILTVADGLHAHAVDNVTLSSNTALTVQDAVHLQSADNITLQIAGEATLSNLDAIHGHFADNVILTSNTSIVVAHSVHGHTADNILISTGDAINLTVADSVHGLFSDNVDLTLETFLAIANARHEHLADNILLTSANTTINVNNALHAHFADNVGVSIRADEKFPLAGMIQARPITTAQQYPLSEITQE